MDTSWNIGSIGIAGPPLRGPSSGRLIAEPPLSPPVSAGSTPVASAQPLEPAAPLAPPMTPSVDSTPGEAHEPIQRAATSLESLLMRFRLITSEQLDEALREKRETGKDVGAIVVERGWVNEDQLSRLLSYAPAFPAPAEQFGESPEPEADAVEADVAPADEPEPPVADPFEVPAEPEPTFSAGPVISTEQEYEPEAPTVEDEAPPVVEDSARAVVPSLTYQIPPALELIEAEGAVEAEATTAAVTGFEPVTPVVEPVAPVVEPVTPVIEPETETAADAEAAADEPQPVSTALVPVQPAVEEPVAIPTPAEPSEPQIVEPAPEPAAAVEPAPATPAAAEPQTVRFVEPAAIETIARVFVRLSNGERVEAGSFDDMGAAKARAEEVVRDISQRDAGWPFFGGRYIRPEAIVSVDVVAG